MCNIVIMQMSYLKMNEKEIYGFIKFIVKLFYFYIASTKERNRQWPANSALLIPANMTVCSPSTGYKYSTISRMIFKWNLFLSPSQAG